MVTLSAWGNDVLPDTVATADTTVRLNRFQQFKEQVMQRIQDKMNEPWDTIRDGTYWWRAM